MNALKPPKHFIKRVTGYFLANCIFQTRYKNVHLQEEMPTALQLLIAIQKQVSNRNKQK